MIATLTVPEHTSAFIESSLLASYTSQLGLLTRQLDQVINRPIALGIDPSIIASIRVLGTSAPESAIAWLERLDAATNETFPLAWADADLTLGLQAGSGDVLIPESLTYAIDPTLFSDTPVGPTPTPAPSETPAEEVVPSLPTSESLTAWDYTVSEITWPAMNAVTSGDLGKLSDFYGTTILSSGNLGAAGARTAHTVIGEVDALVADEALSTQFGLAVEGSAGSQWEAVVANLVASVGAVPSTDDNPASVLLALGRDVATSDPDLGATIDALAAAPSLRTTPLSELLTTPPVSGTLVERTHDEARLGAVAKLLAEERADRTFATIAADPSLITSERRLDLLATISNSWSDNAAGWTAAVSEYTANSIALRKMVRIVKSSSITLLSDRGSLPVTVTNELNQPITVYVTVRPMTPLLRIEDSFVEVTVEPDSQRKASVPVQSLSNGTVALQITLHSVSNLTVGDLTYVETTVQAGWETPVTIGFGAFVLLVFAAGIVRTIVRRRRARSVEV